LKTVAKLIQLEADVYVAPQIVKGDLQEIAAQGFRTVVNNRPDGEAPDQMPDEVAKAAAESLGLTYLYQPVANLRITDDDVVAAFAGALETLPRPVLFYCRSGTRCTLLWAQASAARIGAAEAIAVAGKAGYDLTSIADILEERETPVARPRTGPKAP
jgi:uncharacterized protein (TIGR01244 family)